MGLKAILYSTSNDGLCRSLEKLKIKFTQLNLPLESWRSVLFILMVHQLVDMVSAVSQGGCPSGGKRCTFRPISKVALREHLNLG